MRSIAHHNGPVHLPLFAWADARRIKRALSGYRLDASLNVTPIWSHHHD